MKIRTRALTALLGLVALGAAACGSSFDRGDTINELVDSGLDQATAECVVDEMIDEFGEDKLGSDDDPTAEEQAIVQDIMVDCLSG